jgi:hypothetical protein
MLDKAVTAVMADRAAALAMFNNGGGGFKDRDLYPFRINLSDGKFITAGSESCVRHQGERPWLRRRLLKVDRSGVDDHTVGVTP